MLDGHGNRIGCVVTFMTDDGPVDITDMTDAEIHEFEMHQLGHRDRPDAALYRAFERYLRRRDLWVREFGRSPPAVSFKDWRRTREALLAILENGERQQNEAALKLSRIVPPGWNPRSIIDSQKLAI